MGKRSRIGAFVMAALLGAAGCTVHQSTVPDLAGPSDFALSMNVTATPDSLSIDGGSQSAVVVEAHNASGGPQAGVAFRFDIFVGNSAQDCGTLSARNVVTGSDGRGLAIYTAPSQPLPFPQCANFSPGNVVTVLATPTGNNFDTSNSRSATIRLVPVGIIVPPVSFVPKFTMVPSPTTVGQAVTFDASTTTDPGNTVSAFTWNFGDGSTATGKIVTHAFARVGVFSVTLTATDPAGRAASTTQTITVNAGTAPTAIFTSSPATVRSGDIVFFNAAGSTPGAGRTIVSYLWDFGDGATKNLSTSTTTHDFVTTIANTFTVSLVVVDDLGQRSAAVTKTVAVGP